MIAESVLTPDERRAINRQHAVFEVLSLTTAGLGTRAEQDIRAAVMRFVDPILHLADAATVAGLELQANERRLEMHYPGCLACQPQVLCERYWELRRDRDKLQRVWDRAYRALVDGRR